MIRFLIVEMTAIAIVSLSLALTHAQEGERKPAAPTWEARKVFKDGDGKELPYYLARPAKVVPGTKYSLVVFMHGGGARRGEEKKDDSSKYFLDAALQAKYPHFVLAPQQPSGRTWSGHGYGEGSHSTNPQPTLPIKLALSLIEALPKQIPEIDTNRIYLIGVSNGGYATWDMIARKSELFAAAAPMEGAGDPTQATKMAKLPIWAFHGSRDSIVPVKGTREMVEALKKADGKIQYTEYDRGHGGWHAPLTDMKFMDWMFAQKRGASSDEVFKK